MVWCAPGEPNAGGNRAYHSRLVYVIDERQLTKGCGEKLRVISRVRAPGRMCRKQGKRFSHRRSEFPSKWLCRSVGVEQRAGEFQAHQVVALAMLHAQDPGSEVSRNSGQGSQRGQRGARNLQRNLCGGWDRAANRNQHAAGRDVEGGGKLKEFLVCVSAAPDKDGNRQRQSGPLSALCCWNLTVHAHPFPRSFNPAFPAS